MPDFDPLDHYFPREWDSPRLEHYYISTRRTCVVCGKSFIGPEKKTDYDKYCLPECYHLDMSNGKYDCLAIEEKLL